ncbi:hypothetical protein R0K05_13325 [Planococcus sp. SIMBA_160]
MALWPMSVSSERRDLAGVDSGKDGYLAIFYAITKLSKTIHANFNDS